MTVQVLFFLFLWGGARSALCAGTMLQIAINHAKTWQILMEHLNSSQVLHAISEILLQAIPRVLEWVRGGRATVRALPHIFAFSLRRSNQHSCPAPTTVPDFCSSLFPSINILPSQVHQSRHAPVPIALVFELD